LKDEKELIRKAVMDRKMPSGARYMAMSPERAVQAFKWGAHAFSVQFHIEIETDTVPNWAGIPEYAAALDLAMGPGAVERGM
jgi:GMP synthase-like glutamine amidotransferase